MHNELLNKNILLAIVLVCNFFGAQTTQIQWQGSTELSYGTDKSVKLPSFTNKELVFDNNQIYLQNTTKVAQDESYSVINLVWEKLQDNQKFDLDASLITSEEEAEVNMQKNSFGEGFLLNLRIKVIKKEGDELKKLVSYTLKKEAKVLRLNNNSNKILSTSVTSPLASGTFYKIKVDKSGVYKITSQFLRDNGINLSSINPKNFRIYGNGGLMLPEYNQDKYYKTLQENAIEVVGEEDGRWDEEDYALFYAQGADGYAFYNRSNRKTDARLDRAIHYKNIYEGNAYYFINFDIGAGKRISTTQDTTPTTDLITEYDAYQFINEDKNNLRGIGRLWVDDAFSSAKEVTFNLTDVPSDSRVKFRTRLIAKDAQSTKITLNIGSSTFEQSVSGQGGYNSILFLSSISSDTNKVTFNYTPNISANPNAVFYLDYAEIEYKQPLRFNGSQMNFRNFGIAETSGQNYGFQISSAEAIDRVWDVSDVTNVKNKKNLNSANNLFTLAYLANSDTFNNEFVAFKLDVAYTPSFIGRIENQNLQALTDVDYLIITSSDFATEAKRLADYHTQKNGFKTAIVEPGKIYNEYSSGGQDLTAIRNFISHLKNNGRLKYVLLLGDGSYDYKNCTGSNSNIVPTYESESSLDFSNSYVTDDYFVMTSPQRSTSLSNVLPDLPIGRILAKNITEAKIGIDKTLAYYNALPNQSTPFGEWRMNMDFVVDDDRDGGAPFHDEINSALVNLFETNTSDKKEYHIRKLYLDSFSPETTAGGQRFPQITQGINTAMGNSLFLFYFGHGGLNGWAQERVLTLNEVNQFNNFSSTYSRFPLVSTITCEFTLWDDPNTPSLGEILFKLKSGGPAMMITSSRELGVSYGRRFTNSFLESIFKKENAERFYTLGDAFLMAKNNFGVHPDHLKVNMLGDPAMRLSRPAPRIVIDQIEKPTQESLRGLDFVKIKGRVNTISGDLDEAFNGKIVANIFDKIQSKKTRNNDGGLTPILNYKEEGNPIVKTSGTVKNGVFEIEFYMPKDIDFSLGDGRLLLYADNKEMDVYQSKTVKIGGINPDGIKDNEPPKIKLFMNNTNFVNGGITNENPVFLACVTDDTGINATGAGIGHDITVILDGEVINTIVLNDFYTSGEGNGCVSPSLKDYQKGIVNYPFRNLKSGEHQLVFKVWDINNNSSTASLNFVVRPQAEENLVVKRLLNWPNPFTNKTYIQFEHNCPDVLEVGVQIYTITGKLVKTLRQTVSSEPFREGFRTGRQQIEWDGTDDYGANVGKGTYIYKVFVKSTNQETCKGSSTQIEKMIILK
ncbi:type IX secretion system sortase PorU [Riemerella anatipestifer]|uniref:type IX secretion system sortase PorU n=2 Tax=Riemerella anatipestifer TaxID=34085 RepID=UPI0012ADBE5D|nr:type IX secretion system sortase PorU [Riemerella anatipestifer]MCO7318915.1 type IX secretion system sortase PorU [Riemerella anatipestifer]MCQ4155199.1 type IX secretion system sortase PorU [Riemerella anatipestifer]MCW0474382.1 type IX secretion system sortase PorU [Riemerella anatipestifer]MDD1539588.1 type IX secretion system sortase PorU [Riemerella anatipestifer]MDR7775222.1 type IX secretion system sortase PorU [Riemerella anatipestifer]